MQRSGIRDVSEASAPLLAAGEAANGSSIHFFGRYRSDQNSGHRYFTAGSTLSSFSMIPSSTARE